MERHPTIHQISWFLDLDRNQQLNLNPPYQRRSVWTPKDKRFFLDTVFRNFPCPPIFIYTTIDNNGFATYNVVDGKQRLETILEFSKNKIQLNSDFGDINLDGKKFNDLDIEYKKKFWGYKIVVDYLDTSEAQKINEVFDRVNRNSRNLEPQELRHARFSGWMVKECEGESDDEFWWTLKISTIAKAKRMKNVQVVSELLAVILERKIVGFDQSYLDSIYAKYDSPEETVEGFDLDEYKAEKKRVKETILTLQNTNGAVLKFARTTANFYTLWSFVALRSELIGDNFATKYEEFMRLVNEFVELEQPELIAQDTPQLEAAYNYWNSVKGASTELPQRNRRLASLESFMRS